MAGEIIRRGSGTPLPAHARREITRVAKWGRMLEPRGRDPGGNVAVWGVRAEKESKLWRRVYKGIPDRWRRAVWATLIAQRAGGDERTERTLAVEYENALERASNYDVQIDLDVPRTISGHILFRTRYGQGYVVLFSFARCVWSR